MDDRTLTCPNCGAPVLPSARFCVTCGIRLPEAAADAAPVPQRGWSQPGEDVWIAEAPALDDESEQALSNDLPRERPETGDDTRPAGEEMPGGAAEEPDIAAADPPDDVIALPPAEAGEMSAAADDVPAEPAAGDDAAPSMIGSWSNGALHTGEGEFIAGGSVVDGERVGPEGELAVPSEDHPGQEGEETDQPSATLEDGNDAEAPAETDIKDAAIDESDDEADDFEPAGWVDTDETFIGSDDEPALDDESESELMSYPTQPTAELANGLAVDDRASALDRATSLLDELRALMPQLTGPMAPAAPAVDLAALRDQALTARGEQSFDHYAALREVVTEAVNRPRDIEVVLRLSQRIDDIDALLKERDRLDSALNDLIGRLGE